MRRARLFRQHFRAPFAARPNLSGTDINHRHIHETPGWSLRPPQKMPRLPVDPVLGINPRRPGHPGGYPVAGPRDHTNRDTVHDPSPVFPAVKLRQIVCAHQPDKSDLWIQSLQRCQSIGSCTCTRERLDVRHLDPWVLHHISCCRHSPVHGRGPAFFQRIARRYQPPNPIQPERLHRLKRDMHMALMRWIKRPAEQTNDLPRSRIGYAVPLHTLLMFRTAGRCQSTGCTTSPSRTRPGRTTSAHHPPCPRTAE